MAQGCTRLCIIVPHMYACTFEKTPPLPCASVRFWPQITLQEQMPHEQLLLEHKQSVVSPICPRTSILVHTAPGAYFLYAPGALCIQICSWSICAYLTWNISPDYLCSRNMLPKQLLQEHNLGPKSYRCLPCRSTGGGGVLTCYAKW